MDPQNSREGQPRHRRRLGHWLGNRAQARSARAHKWSSPDLNEAAADKVAAEIEGTGVAAAVRQDVADPESVRQSVELAVERFGGLHLAVNNAGIGGDQALVADYSLEDWDRVIAINLSGVFFGSYQIPALLRSGGGSIVNMASILGSVGSANSAAYVAAKHGVVGLTKTAALEYAAQRYQSEWIGPGYIDTPLLNSLDRGVYNGLSQAASDRSSRGGRRKSRNWRFSCSRTARRSSRAATISSMGVTRRNETSTFRNVAGWGTAIAIIWETMEAW